MRNQFNHAANNSPRSGANKEISPIVGAIVFLVAVAAIIWLTTHA